MLWINFLHLYQPANADDHTIKENVVVIREPSLIVIIMYQKLQQMD